MGRLFKLNGNTATKLKQIETIIPRMMARMSTKTYGVIPSSVVAFHKAEVLPGEDIFKCGMFKSRIKKLLFMLDSVEGKGLPEYVLTLIMGLEERKIKVNTKRLSHIMLVDIDVPDEAILSVSQSTEDIILKNVYVTALINFDQDLNEVKTFVTEEFLKEADDEGI